MKLKLDENIPLSAKTRLARVGFDTDTVLDEGLGGHPDPDVWAAAQSEGRFLITQDLDFSDVRVFAAGTHHGVLIVRLPDADQWRVADYLVAWFSGAEAKSWVRCFVVATPHKVRVIRPSSDGLTT